MKGTPFKRKGYLLGVKAPFCSPKPQGAFSNEQAADRNFTCLFKTRCFPFQYLSIWRACRVLTMSTGFTAVSWLISGTEELLRNWPKCRLPTPYCGPPSLTGNPNGLPMVGIFDIQPSMFRKLLGSIHLTSPNTEKGFGLYRNQGQRQTKLNSPTLA